MAAVLMSMPKRLMVSASGLGNMEARSIFEPLPVWVPSACCPQGAQPCKSRCPCRARTFRPPSRACGGW
eukprot:1129468-Lingulodinium_polyedra.AAC.1